MQSSKRLATAAVLIPLVYLLIEYAPTFYFYLFVMFSVAVGLYEFYRMFKNSGYYPQTTMGIILGLLVVTGFYIGSDREGITGLIFSPDVMVAAAFVLGLLCRLFSGRDTNGALVDVALTFTGVVYVAWLAAYLVLLKDWTMGGIDGRDLLFFLLLVTWATDTGAYYIGSSLGRHKLYPKISPKKSVEGAVGGLAFAVGMAVVCKYWFYRDLDVVDAVALGFILGIVGQVGDLAESMIKRSARVKDSGGIIPGHGGMLDRMDSLLLNAPALYYYTIVFITTKNGMPL
jgi:phosphatidate cytidylyltransferase